jgi:hypothetical protein
MQRRELAAGQPRGTFVDRDASVHTAGIDTILRAARSPLRSDSPTCPNSRKLAVSRTKDAAHRERELPLWPCH